jgi:arabinose-5-phosphate isomerase
MPDRKSDILAGARQVFSSARAALAVLSERLDGEFERAVEAMLACEGRVVVTGIGKSGHVAAKLASTLSSTGTPAAFLHAAEAVHGDLGFIRGEDLCVIVSKSGGGEELAAWLPFLRRRGCPVVALCGNPDSRLAREADIHLDASVAEEACPHNLAPTTSSTAAMAMGDALAIALLGRRGFGADDFLRLHPGGILGKRLSLRVEDLMHQGEDLPLVAQELSLRTALTVIIDKGLGMACVTDGEGGALTGVLTDGDLKRLLLEGGGSDALLDRPVAEFANTEPRRVAPEMLVTDALTLMEGNQPGPITSLVVVAPDGSPRGVIHIHDILRAGLS